MFWVSFSFNISSSSLTFCLHLRYDSLHQLSFFPRLYFFQHLLLRSNRNQIRYQRFQWVNFFLSNNWRIIDTLPYWSLRLLFLILSFHQILGLLVNVDLHYGRHILFCFWKIYRSSNIDKGIHYVPVICEYD